MSDNLIVLTLWIFSVQYSDSVVVKNKINKSVEDNRGNGIARKN